MFSKGALGEQTQVGAPAAPKRAEAQHQPPLRGVIGGACPARLLL